MFEIGYSLRAARERQGIGLPEAELATKIRAKYIRALEEEDFDALPADTYARGFLRTYADYLGLDGEIYVDEYASRFHNAEWEDEPRRAPRGGAGRGASGRSSAGRSSSCSPGSPSCTALVFVAWKFGNTGRTSRRSTKHNTAPALVLHGVGTGTYVVVRRELADGPAPLPRHAHAGPRRAVHRKALLRRRSQASRAYASRTRPA